MRFIIFGIGILLNGVLANPVERLHPDAGLSLFELAEKYGYPLERHQDVQTEDGYLLEMQRIPHGLNNAGEVDKPVVLVMHGLASSSSDWVNLGPGKAIALLLADAGYDVWLGNSRGNAWSRKHVSLDLEVDKEAFYNFSFFEVGKFDLAAKIDYILKESGATKIFYIGHSQGTAAFFTLMAERPEYNEKIRLMSALAPIAFMNNSVSPILKFLSDNIIALEELSKSLGIYDLKPTGPALQEIGKFCVTGGKLEQLCRNIVSLICGQDEEQLDSDFIPVVVTNFPGGASVKQFLHFGQEYGSGKFGQWDFNSEELNNEHYGQPTPPDIDLSKIAAPIALHYGQNDWLASVTDVERLRDALPNVVHSNKIAYEHFNHYDFLWAIDVVELLYNDVLKVMEEY